MEDHDEHVRFLQAADEEHNLKAAAIGLIALLLFAIATLWAWRIVRATGGSNIPQVTNLGGAPIPTVQAAPPEVGMVFQFQFDPTRLGPPLDEARRARLEAWGFVDRKSGRVHMPIDRAIDEYVAEQAK